MKYLSSALGIIGALVFLLAVFAKLMGMPVVEVVGFAFSRVGMVLVANALLLAAILVHLLGKK